MADILPNLVPDLHAAREHGDGFAFTPESEKQAIVDIVFGEVDR